MECQDGRSQHKNYEKALQVLRSRLFQAEEEQLAKERADQRKSLVSTGIDLLKLELTIILKGELQTIE